MTSTEHMGNMTPEEARKHLTFMDMTRSFYIDQTEVKRALETIAGMTKETNPVIVNPDTNGGKYETKHLTRYVTEWGE